MRSDKMRILRAAICGLLLAAASMYVYTAIVPTPRARAASQFANIVCDQSKAIATSANVQLATAGGNNMFIYVCGYQLSNGNAAAASVSIVEGTGATCGTNTLAMVGNATGTASVALAASGGTVNYGGGTNLVTKTAVAGDNVCLFTAAGPIAGVIAFTQAQQ